MKLNFGEILEATGAVVVKGRAETENEFCYTFSTDTRTIKTGDVYIPLKGETFDGENFIENALNSGANAYFTTDKNKFFDKAEFILLVEDTKIAYLQLANFYKNKINPYTIAVTGSSGKTTVKEMMYSVFKNAGNTVKSILNHNNEVGLCQTLSNLEKDIKERVDKLNSLSDAKYNDGAKKNLTNEIDSLNKLLYLLKSSSE